MNNNIITIPYRDRERHLSYFLEHSAPLLARSLDDLEILIVEQVPGKLFNRGMLLNIGFVESFTPSSYFFTHDVDTNPLPPAVEKLYSRPVGADEALGIYTAFSDTLGGTIKLRGETFLKINGFPNDFWGWGVEDKALQCRAYHHNIQIRKTVTDWSSDAGDYFKVFTQDDKEKIKSSDVAQRSNFYYNTYAGLPPAEQDRLNQLSGLNNLKYELCDTELLNDYTRKLTVKI